MSTTNYGKMRTEEIILDQLSKLNNNYIYRSLDKEGKRKWEIRIIRKILFMRRISGAIMKIIDLCMYLMIILTIIETTSAKGKFNPIYPIFTILIICLDIIMSRIINRIEICYVKRIIK